MIRLRVFSTVLCLLLSSQVFASIALRSEYSYDQRGVLSFDGSDEVPGDIQRTIRLPNATYRFDLQASSSNVYELKSKTRIEVDIDGRAVNGNSGDGWFQTRARASSASQLIDTAIVEGLSGQVGGFVEFLWDVSGGSLINLDPKLRGDGYRINELFTTALFNPLEDSAVPELLLNDQSQPPLGTQSIDSAVAGFIEPVVLAVDWFAGEELDVFFELQTSASIGVQNLDAAGFEAVVESDFSNTATLKEILIYDDQGNLIPGAYLVGEGDFIYDPAGLGPGPGSGDAGDPMVPNPIGTPVDPPPTTPNPNPVPEPATIAIWLILGGLLGVCKFRRRTA